MKTCPSCGELNGENASQCYKCHTLLSKAGNYRKICPKCQFIYSDKADTCDKCGGRLAVYADADRAAGSHSGSSSGGCGLYVVSVLIPMVGIILGLIYIARGEDEQGKSYIMTSVITWVIITVLALVLGSCNGYL